MDAHTIVAIRGLCLAFSGCPIFDQFSLDLRPGEFHYLLGPNAAGKSTLVQILSGHQPIQHGEIQIQSSVYTSGLIPARAHRIHAIHQSIGVFDNLSVFDNIYIPCMSLPVRRKQPRRTILELLSELQLPLDLDAPLCTLSMGEKRLVEFLAAFLLHPRILLLDDPGASLSDFEQEKCMQLLLQFRENGTTILYCSCRLDKLFSISDRLSIVQGGRNRMTVSSHDITPADIGAYLYGQGACANRFPRIFCDQSQPAPLFTVHELEDRYGFLRHISLSLRRGEIIGITGISGSGKTLLSQAMIGGVPLASGHLFFHPTGRIIQRISQAMDEGIGYLPEDAGRKIMPNLSAAKNITISNLGAVSVHSMLHEHAEENVGLYYARHLGISSYFTHAQPAQYSFGEQQKLNLARLLFSGNQVIIADDPFSSIDIPARIDLYNLFNAYVGNGNGVILFSADLVEICGMCDRVYVLRDGCIVDELIQPEITVERVAASAYGTS